MRCSEEGAPRDLADVDPTGTSIRCVLHDCPLRNCERHADGSRSFEERRGRTIRTALCQLSLQLARFARTPRRARRTPRTHHRWMVSRSAIPVLINPRRGARCTRRMSTSITGSSSAVRSAAAASPIAAARRVIRSACFGEQCSPISGALCEQCGDLGKRHLSEPQLPNEVGAVGLGVLVVSDSPSSDRRGPGDRTSSS